MTESKTVNKAKRYDNYIVAIGASAGGLEAIHLFFDNMPANASFSFVVIQHLSSEHKSLLVELVGKHTHMKVFEAENHMAIQQNCVYIIPNDKLLTVKNGRLKLADKTQHKVPNSAIDHFLFTLAEDKKDKAIAIILSGTGTDGTKGIQKIKDHGGMVIVQDPATAKFDGMPNSAIATGCADFILSPAEMSQELFSYANEEPLSVLQDGKIDEKLLEELFGLVHGLSGNNFNLYKTPTIIRRIGRRMNENNMQNFGDYVSLLRKDEKELAILSQDFLIGVTRFFRDTDAFEMFSTQFKEILDRKSDGDSLRMWVCACSTGQEAYTIAIIAQDCLKKSGKKVDVKIFATDIDDKSIDIAAKNQYPLSIKKEIPDSFFKEYITQDGKYYSVIPEVRKMIVFAKHDVTKSPPFIKNDIVTCRNMLIYVNTILQEKILSTFHFSLIPGGLLFLGSSESVAPLKEGFTEISGKLKFFRKTGVLNYASYNTYNTGSRTSGQPDKSKGKSTEFAMSPIEKGFNSFLTRELAYAGVYIDKSYIMQDAIGNYRKYLSLPSDKIELNVLKMVPKQVSVLLNTAIRKAWNSNTTVHLRRVRFEENNEVFYVKISVQPPEEDNGIGLTLVVFGESTPEGSYEKEERTFGEMHLDQTTSDYVFELEAELNEARNSLQLATEEMETTNEELQSTNEELLSANEELQSSNEELQSLNEELHTLNTEHQVKISELIDLNDDLDNYFRSTDIGQVFVDSSLYIRKFNTAAVGMVNLIIADIGRSIQQISNNLQGTDLNSDIQQVLDDGVAVEKEVRIKNGDTSLMRIMPYVKKDGKVDGVVITFVNISQLTELNNIITGVFNASLNGVMAFKSVRNKQNVITDFECITFNESAGTLLRKNAEELTGASIIKDIPEISGGNLLEAYRAVVEKGNSFQVEYKLYEKVWVEIVAVKMSDGFAATITNITKQKSAQEKLKHNYNELLGTRENLKQLNSELEQKIEERTLLLSESESRFNLVSQATNDTIWDWDLSDNTIWRSASFKTIFGYEDKPEKRSISFAFTIIHPEDLKRVQESVNNAINKGEQQWTCQYRLKKADGSYATILDRGSILFDENAVPYRMVGSMLDISQLIAAQDKLNSSERKFRKIFDSNVIGMIFSNVVTGRIENANGIFLEMLGYTVEDFENGAISWKDITPPEAMAASAASAELLRTQGYCPPFEKQYYHKDGHAVDVMIGSAILDDDVPEDAVTYIIDITTQKESDKKRDELQHLIKRQQDEFHSIFKKAPALISIRRGKDLVYEFVNEAFEQFDGGRVYIGKKTLGHGSQFESPELIALEEQVVRTGETLVANSYKFTRPATEHAEAQEAWFDLILNPVYSSEGQIDGVSFFGFEVTDLITAQITTKALMSKKDEFMSIASHELKTPVTSIKGFLQFALKMAEQRKFDNIFSFIDKANKQVGKLTALVDDLLDVTKIQAGKMTFTMSEFNIREVLQDSIDGVQSNLTHQEIITDIEDLTVNGDRHRIEQVISNFISNGLKYAPDGKQLFIEAKKTGAGNVRISVKDQGIGIPNDKAEFIFDRFFRVEESSNHFSGLGLGLYISAQIIERHQGKIGVISDIGEGSEFWFEIPIELAS